MDHVLDFGGRYLAPALSGGLAVAAVAGDGIVGPALCGAASAAWLFVSLRAGREGRDRIGAEIEPRTRQA